MNYSTTLRELSSHSYGFHIVKLEVNLQVERANDLEGSDEAGTSWIESVPTIGKSPAFSEPPSQIYRFLLLVVVEKSSGVTPNSSNNFRSEHTERARKGCARNLVNECK